jgi:hypothetical protein
MGMARSVAGVLVFGWSLILADAALGGSWPSHSAGSWLLFIGGLVVIGLAFHVAQAMHESRGKHR